MWKGFQNKSMWKLSSDKIFDIFFWELLDCLCEKC